MAAKDKVTFNYIVLQHLPPLEALQVHQREPTAPIATPPPFCPALLVSNGRKLHRQATKQQDMHPKAGNTRPEQQCLSANKARVSEFVKPSFSREPPSFIK